MNRFAEFNLFHDDGHPPEDALYLFVDGELPEAQLVLTAKHLDACWQCRVRVEKIQATISTFVEYRNQVQTRSADLPPRNWQRFGQELERQAESGAQSVTPLDRLRQLLTKMTVAEWPRRAVLASISLLLIGSLAALFWWLDRTTPVSARELLQRAEKAYTQELRATAQPVTYQKLSLQSPRTPHSVQWELWHDTERGRLRQAVSSATGNSLPAKTEAARGRKSGLLAMDKTADESFNAWRELEQVYQVNRLNWQQPLSAAACQAWRQATSLAREEVVSARRDGQAVLVLKTIANNVSLNGAITESQFTIRQSDWHPVAHLMRVKWDDGVREYEISEAKYAVVSLAEIGAAFFAEAAARVSATPSVLPSASVSATPVPAPSALPSAAASPAITAAELHRLEVEALDLLHRAGADLGEQIEVRRTGSQVIISGVVEDAARQAQLTKQLAALVTHPALRVEIRTFAEAMARESQTPAENSSASVRLQFEGERAEPPAFPALRQFFTGQGNGADVEASVNRYSRQTLTHAREAMQRAYALRQLHSRLQPSALSELPEEARLQLLQIVQSHARSLAGHLRALEQTLQPVFPVPGAESSIVTAAPEASFADLARIVDQLFNATAMTDRLVRNSFAASAGAGSAVSVSSTEFHRSLRTAQQSAATVISFR